MTQPQPLPIQPACYQDDHLTVDFDRETAYLDGAPLKLTFKAYALLSFLARHAGELVRREELLLLVWGYGVDIRTRTLDVHVRRLRKGLGRYGVSYIETIFGVGYRFQPFRTRAQSDTHRVAALDAAESRPARTMAAGNAR